MAGGWGKQGSGVPLSDRVRGSEGSDAYAVPVAVPVGVPTAVPTAVPAASGVPQCPARHCWVAEADAQGVKRPGLLVEWRADGTGWEGRVVYAAALRPGRWSLVEEWMPASRLTPL